jgi:hypothetical protein
MQDLNPSSGDIAKRSRSSAPSTLDAVKEGEYAHPRYGISFDWLAIDGEEHLAVFDSDGYGPVPPPVISSVDDVDEATNKITDLPEQGDCIPEADLHGVWLGDEELAKLAKRGFFVYVWDLYRGPYRRVATPTAPLTLANVRDPAVASAATLWRARTNFAASGTFDLFSL